MKGFKIHEFSVEKYFKKRDWKAQSEVKCIDFLVIFSIIKEQIKESKSDDLGAPGAERNLNLTLDS